MSDHSKCNLSDLSILESLVSCWSYSYSFTLFICVSFFYILRNVGMPICEVFAQVNEQPNVFDMVHLKDYDEVWSAIYSSSIYFDSI